MWKIAVKAMLGDRSKLFTALLGVSFAIVLVNLQSGLYVGLIRKASLLVDHGEADIWIGHRHMSNVDIGTYIPERWITRIRDLPGVERVDPYLVMFCPATMPDGRFEVVMVVGSEPASLLGGAWNIVAGSADGLRQPDAILVDVCDLARLGHPQIGDVREINGRRCRIVGMTKNIVGFSANPYVFTTLERARQYLGVRPGYCSYFLVKAKPGADVQALKASLQERLPDLDVCDRGEYSWKCMEFWLTRTGIGLSFGLATVLGLLVGLAVVAQTLYASVTERLKEFGTLKALGATNRSVALFILAQALGTAALGAVLGLAAAAVIGIALDSPRAPVVFTLQGACLSVVLVTGVCLLGTWAPYWRIRSLDPAGVLRG